MSVIRVFVGSNDRWAEVEPVVEHSIRKHTRAEVEITFVRPRRFGIPETGCTTFTNVRYCVPQLAKRTGFAIYLDVDMLLLADIAELWEYRRPKRWCRLADGSDEVAVIDCSVPWGLPDMRKMGKYNKFQLRKMIIHYANVIPLAWNSEDRVKKGAKLLHFTGLGKQPWHHPGKHPNAEAVAIWEQLRDEARG